MGKINDIIILVLILSIYFLSCTLHSFCFIINFVSLSQFCVVLGIVHDIVLLLSAGSGGVRTHAQ